MQNLIRTIKKRLSIGIFHHGRSSVWLPSTIPNSPVLSSSLSLKQFTISLRSVSFSVVSLSSLYTLTS